MNYRVLWRDGSFTDNLSYKESMALIEERPQDWSSVQFMENGKDCHPDNEKKRLAAWGAKKKAKK
jgi:hypothetical protein